jgi:hypothetical protein
VTISLKKARIDNYYSNDCSRNANTPTPNTDGIFNRFVTVFANRARNLCWELS